MICQPLDLIKREDQKILSKAGIRVVGLNPGPVATENFVEMKKKAAYNRWRDEKRYKDFLAPFAFGRAAALEEVANMLVFLVSDLSSYTSGTIPTVDGRMVPKGPLF